MKTEKIPVLKAGYVQLIDHMGSDASICQAARISYDNFDVDRKPSDDRKLIRYLMSHRHTSPFEMAVLQFRIRCPMYIGEQWLRHRTGSFNKLSGRYSEMPTDFYLPKKTEWRAQDQDNKQGSSGYADLHSALNIAILDWDIETTRIYNELLAAGVAKELARSVLPAATMTEFVWKTDLHNLLHFLQLRLDSHAQQEIREYAQVIAGIVADLFPFSWEAFEDYRLKAMTFSRLELHAIAELMNDKEATYSGMSARERAEFLKKVAEIGNLTREQDET